MLNVLLSLYLLCQVQLPVNPLPSEDTLCEIAEQSCVESFKDASETLLKVQETDWDVVTEVLRVKAQDMLLEGQITGQIGYFYANIGSLQVRLGKPDAALKSYRLAKVYFIKADDIFHEVLEVLTPPKSNVKTKGV